MEKGYFNGQGLQWIAGESPKLISFTFSPKEFEKATVYPWKCPECQSVELKADE